MRGEDRRAAAASLRRVAGQLGRAGDALGAQGGRYYDEARHLLTVAEALDEEADREDEEDEARACWVARRVGEGF